MATVNYIWDPLADSYLMETDGSGSTQAVYTVEPDLYGQVISQRRGGTSSYYHYDGLGSTRELTNSSETVSDTNMYDAWGVNRASSGATVNPFEYVGESGYDLDTDTDTTYVRARSYDAGIGRWLSVDPDTFVDSINEFVYVENRPLRFVDPTGTQNITAPASGPCKIEVECVKLLGIGGYGLAEHCGLKITTPNGTVIRYHVLGGIGAKCDIVNGQASLGGVSGSYYVRDTFVTGPSACKCIAANAARITAANLPYKAVPASSCWGGEPTCNSNYVTKCLLRHCGIESRIDNYWFKPVGWGHRMERCTSRKYIIGPFAVCCWCLNWESVDDAWCSPRNTPQVNADPTG
jgi:RHS repeat-associated protein